MSGIGGLSEDRVERYRDKNGTLLNRNEGVAGRLLCRMNIS